MARHVPVLGVALLLATPFALAAPAGEIVSLTGKGEYRQAPARDWVAARVKQPLEGGSFVRTVAAEARMAVLLADRTQFTLQGIATAQVKDPAEASAGKSIVDMVRGTGRFQSRTPVKGFAVGTPSGLAAIRGTEWLLEVEEARTVVTVVEGEVEVANAQGRLTVRPDEQAVLEPGRAPVKRRIQDARSRVQWVGAFSVETARYPELRALPSGGEGASLAAIAKAVDGGEFAAARTLAMLHVARTDLARATGHFLAADLSLWFGDADESLAILQAAGKRFPAEGRTQAFVAWAALSADRFDAARQAAAQALARWPGVLESQLAAGDVARLDGDYFAARAAFREATRLAPKDWRGWYGLARVEGERGNVARARRASDRALEPGRRPPVLAERGALEASVGEGDDAARLLGEALAAQPDDFATWAALGNARLRRGDPAGALDALVRATLLEPRHARAHVDLAVAYWQQGLRAQAFASLERASQADPRDPLPYQYAALMHGDLLAPGLAVEQAREALARAPYAKSLDAIAGGTRGLANVGAAYAQFGLQAWALRAAQASHDPLWSGSHFFLADRYTGRYGRNSELVQGFLTDPVALGTGNGFQPLVRRPEANATLAWRGARDKDNRFTEPTLTVSGIGAEGRAAAFAEVAEARDWRPDGTTEDRTPTTTVGIGLRPRHDVGVFLYGNRVAPAVRSGTDDPRVNYTLVDGSARRVDAGLGWRPSADQWLWLKAGNGSEEGRLRTNTARTATPTSTTVFRQGSDFLTQPRAGDVQARWLARLAGGHEVSMAAEGARWRAIDYLERDAFAHTVGSSGLVESVRQDIRDTSRTGAVAGRTRLGAVQLEAQVDVTDYEKTNAIVVRRDYANQLVVTNDDHARDGVNGRAGLAWSPSPAFTARLAWQRWLRPASTSSLGATATAGILVDDRFVLAGGRLERTRLQVEWEPVASVLVAAFADRQSIDNLYSALAGTLNDRPDTANLERLRSRSFNLLAALGELEGYPSLSRGDLREAGVALNVITSRAVALYAEATHADSENTLANPGKAFAWLPRRRAALGASWFPGHGVAFGARALYRGERFRDEANTAANRLPAEWNGQVQAYWESRDKRWSVEALVAGIGAKSASESLALAATWRY